MSAFSRGQAQINLLVLLLPVAIALFMALPGARLAATMVFPILYLFLAFLLLAPMLGTMPAVVRIPSGDLPILWSVPVAFVFVSMLGSLLGLLHWMLFSPPFDDHLGG